MRAAILLYRIPLLLLLLASMAAAAQLPLPAQPIYTHYTSYNSGLPTELVYKIVADKNGYLWLATDKGLIRYNGKEFKPVNTGRVEDVISILKTKQDMLWVFTYTGHTAGVNLNTHRVIDTDSLYGLNKLKGDFKPVVLGLEWDDKVILYEQGFKNISIADIQKSNSILKSKAGSDAAKEIIAHYRIASHPETNHISIKLDSILRYNNAGGFLIRDSFIVIGSDIFLASKNAEARRIFSGEDYGLKGLISGMAREGKDLYVGSLKGTGLCRIRNFFSAPRSGQQIEKLLPDEEHITSVEVDYAGNIWASTYSDGIYFFPHSEFLSLHYDRNTSGLYSNNVTALRQFKGGITAIGYDNGAAEFYGAANNIRKYKIPFRYDLQKIICIENIENRWTLFSPAESFQARLNKNHFALPDIFLPTKRERFMAPNAAGYRNGALLNDTFFYASATGNIWAIGPSGMIFRYIPSQPARRKKICVLPVINDGLYIGTTRGCYHDTTALPYLRDVQVNSISLVNNNLFFGTNDGVYVIPKNAAGDSSRLRMIIPVPCYDIKNDEKYTYLRSTEELITVENNTLNIIARFSFKRYAIPFALNNFCVDSNYIGLAGNRGIFYIPKESIVHPEHPAAPRVHILCSLTNYSPTDTAYTCRYSKTLSALFEIDILDYSNEEQHITYRVFRNNELTYTQEDIKEDAQINFQPLSPGHYRIEYLISFGSGSTERQACFYLTITPLWYQQWWFIPSLILLAVVLLIYIFSKWYSYKTERNHRKLKQELYLHELESQSLFGQLKPHFIFNVLTPLQGFFIREQKMEGLNYLNNFSGLMRGILNGIRDKQTSLKNEIEFVSQYLQIQQSRFNGAFTYNITLHLQKPPEEYIIPTLLLQPLAENAVEHGIVKSAGNGNIEIIINEDEHTLRISVRDNGRGLPAAFKLKDNHALNIITERMHLLKKMKGTGGFEIANNKDGAGTTATILFAKILKT